MKLNLKEGTMYLVIPIHSSPILHPILLFINVQMVTSKQKWADL